jgi:aminoglycoside phosphotransferase (APT) family kinase protein
LSLPFLGVKPPGPLLASGRDADIFEYGPGMVLRRSRHSRSMALEAQTMEYLHRQGYPVPAIDQVSDDGCDLVMERVDGLSMVEWLGRKPWTVRRQGAILADLHRRLHEIRGPAFLPAAPIGRGEHLVHLDLHPLNVIIGPKGPVVIDWTSASRGDPAVDVGLAWVLMAAGEIPGGGLKTRVLGAFRSLLVNSFVERFDRATIAGCLKEVVAWKVRDPNMSEKEQQAMWRVVEQVAR